MSTCTPMSLERDKEHDQFSPKYTQPFTLEEATELSVTILSTEISRLTNSITHLKRSNQEIQSFIDETDDNDDPSEGNDFREIVKENEQVISSQQERIKICHLALQRKLGKEQADSLVPNHYDESVIQVELRPSGTNAAHTQSGQDQSAGRVESMDDGEGEGMYL